MDKLILIIEALVLALGAISSVNTLIRIIRQSSNRRKTIVLLCLSVVLLFMFYYLDGLDIESLENNKIISTYTFLSTI